MRYRDFMNKYANKEEQAEEQFIDPRAVKPRTRRNRSLAGPLTGAIAMPFAASIMNSLDPKAGKMTFGDIAANAAGGYVVGDLTDRMLEWLENRRAARAAAGRDSE